MAHSPRGRFALQLALGVALFAAIDHTLFSRSLYFRVVAPQSALGTVVQALDSPRHVPDGRRAVLLLGNSRVGEGFSASIADDVARRSGWTGTFVNSAVAGSYPRSWSYLLRQMQPTAGRIAAVAIMTASVQDVEGTDEFDPLSDLALIHPLLRLADLPSIADTFPSRIGRQEALKAVLLRGYFYKSDVADLLARPWSRIHDVSLARQHGFEYIRDYPGRSPSLTGITFDPATGALFIPERLPAIQTSLLPSYATQLRTEPARLPSADYRRRWFGSIADICAQAGIPLFVYRIPRGPLHYLAGADDRPIGVLREMRDAGRIRLMPAAMFDELERPDYFFDALHMNSAGREIFSRRFAAALIERVQAAQ